MAMNWIIAPLNGRPVHVHEGGTGGFSSLVAFDREAGRGVVVLSDTALHSLGGLGSIGLHLLDPTVPLGPPRKTTPAPAALVDALVQDEQVQLAKSQTLERYIEKGKTWVDSLTNQAATQLVLINKLQTDTKQRVVLYDALTSSLKTAQQQDVAHRINEIGVKTDQEAQAAMAAIGAATNDKMAGMLEAHEGHMVFARQILEQKAKADERFARRFAKIVEKHDKNAYGG